MTICVLAGHASARPGGDIHSVGGDSASDASVVDDMERGAAVVAEVVAVHIVEDVRQREEEAEEHEQGEIPAEAEVEIESDRASEFAQLRRMLVRLRARLPLLPEEWIRIESLDHVTKRTDELIFLIGRVGGCVDADSRAAVHECALLRDRDAAELRFKH